MLRSSARVCPVDAKRGREGDVTVIEWERCSAFESVFWLCLLETSVHLEIYPLYNLIFTSRSYNALLRLKCGLRSLFIVLFVFLFILAKDRIPTLGEPTYFYLLKDCVGAT